MRERPPARPRPAGALRAVRAGGAAAGAPAGAALAPVDPSGGRGRESEERERGGERIWNEKRGPRYIFGSLDSNEKWEKQRIRGRSQPKAVESAAIENLL